jgi:superfamily I DNA/RNA helicase
MERWIDFQQSSQQRLVGEDLDREQNRAKNFASQGQALIRGVAGSGKSLVLKSRVKKLVNEGFNQILVLCYNRFMNAWMYEKVNAKNDVKVECATFHSWAARKLQYDYQCDREPQARQDVIKLAETSKLKYQAILIDEAQDFYDEWFIAMLKVLDEQTNSLFFVYDNTQSVYDHPHRRKADWAWKQLGFKIPGARSQIFDVNYRNSPEILETAWKFFLPSLNQVGMRVAKREKAQGSLGTIVEPKTKQSRSSGIKPLLLQLKREEMTGLIAQQVQMALEIESQSSIAVLTHPNQKQLRQEISQQLHRLGIQYHAPKNSGERNGNVVQRPAVVVDSWNAVKGIEFDAVILAGVDWIPEQSEHAFQEQTGLYTAMTRARDHLVMLYEERNAIAEMLEAAIASPNQLETDNGETSEVTEEA